MNKRPSLATFISIAGVGLLAWAALAWVGFREIRPAFPDSGAVLPNATLAKLGLFGDMFGCINAVFSGLAMSGAIYALMLQSWQIGDQKKHDHDMLRRNKLEEIAGMLSEVLHRIEVLLIGIKEFVAPEGIDPSRRVKFELEIQEIERADFHAHLLHSLYFPSCIGLTPANDSLGVNFRTPTKAFLAAGSSATALITLNEFARLSKVYYKECNDCLKFIIKNNDDIVSERPVEK